MIEMRMKRNSFFASLKEMIFRQNNLSTISGNVILPKSYLVVNEVI